MLFRSSPLVALFIRGLAEGAPAAAALKETKARLAETRIDGGYGYLDLERMAYYVHKDSYRRAIAGHADALRRELTTRARADPSSIRQHEVQE